MCIYAIGNIRGFYDELEEALTTCIDLSGDNLLILLGDYIRFGPDSYKILDRVMALEKEYGKDKVIALCGNQEFWTLVHKYSINSFDKDDSEKDSLYINWLKTLRPVYKNDKYVFFSGGILTEMVEYAMFPTGVLSPLFMDWYLEFDNEHLSDNWIFSRIKVLSIAAQMDETYEECLKERIESIKINSIDEAVSQLKILAEAESEIKLPQVLKIDTDIDFGENVKFWRQGNWEHIKKSGYPNVANYIMLGDLNIKN